MRAFKKHRRILVTAGALALLPLLGACGGGGSSSSGSTVPGESRDGQPAAAQPIARVEIPIDASRPGAEASLARNFYFVFDGSGSMRRRPESDCRGDQRFDTKLEGAQWALREFLAKVPADVHVGLYVFDDKYRSERVPLGTGNRAIFEQAVDEIKAGGSTPLAEAIRFATDQLIVQYQQQLGYGEFRLVVVTDGQANEIPEAAIYATERGIPIYAIGLCIGEDHPLRHYAVSYRAADSFADLSRGLEDTLAELPTYDATEFAGEPETP